jgi:hypothetical protein
MEREAEHIRGLLPPLPGRKWVVEQAMGIIGNIAGPITAKVTAGDVACEIVYRGRFGREKSLQAGLFPALLMASRRQIHQSLIATALAQGAVVSGLSPERMDADLPDRMPSRVPAQRVAPAPAVDEPQPEPRSSSDLGS